MERKLDEIEREEEQILAEEGGVLIGSKVGRRRVAVTWAVGDAWERFSAERVAVVQKAFRVVGLALPIDGSADDEISIKGIETGFLTEGLRDWQEGGILVDDEDDPVALDVSEDEAEVFFE